MKISIVIPVYNEADSLGACLEAIARQTIRPHEVIVVDNNSTDNTADIAESFDFVTLLRESRQGVVHARSRGFDAAQGEIIARIDADTILPADWLASVRQVFKDPTVDAASGVALYYNVAAAGLFNAIDLFLRRHLTKRMKNRLYLWGANMALRRDAWTKVRPKLCHEGGIHEDYDIAIHLQRLGGKVTFDERLRAHVSSRRIDVGYLEFIRYAMVCPRTYAKHATKEGRYIYTVVAICAIGYLPAKLLHRGYDSSSGRFAWRRLIGQRTAAQRVDPTTYVA